MRGNSFNLIRNINIGPGRGEADNQNWKAAKALLVIIPLLGITYLITILGEYSYKVLLVIIHLLYSITYLITILGEYSYTPLKG